MRCKPHSPPTRRRGAGVVFLLAIGILVVLIILLFSQARTQDATGREINVVALGGRASVAADSALTELSYRLDEAARDPDREAPVARALRGFVPGVTETPAEDSLLDDEPYFLRTFELSHELTREAYAPEGDVELSPPRAGLVRRAGFEGEEDLLTRDHKGLVALEQEVTVTPPWGGTAVRVAGRGLRSFRSVLLDVPPPFSEYSAVILETPDDDNRLREYYDAFADFRRRFLGDGGAESALPEFPVPGIEAGVGGYFVTTSPSIPSAGFSIDPLLPNPANLGVTERDDWADALAALQVGGWRRLAGDPADELVAHTRLLTAQGLGPRSTFEVDSMADLAGYFGDEDGGRLELKGVIHVKGAIVLEHEVSGPAVLWTDSAQGVIIRKFERSSNPGHVVVISTKGDIRIEVTPGSVVPASLVAPEGTAVGLDRVTVQGRLVLGRFPPGMAVGPTVAMPTPVVERPAPGAGWGEQGLARSEVVFDPGYVRKEYARQRLKAD